MTWCLTDFDGFVSTRSLLENATNRICTNIDSHFFCLEGIVFFDIFTKHASPFRSRIHYFYKTFIGLRVHRGLVISAERSWTAWYEDDTPPFVVETFVQKTLSVARYESQDSLSLYPFRKRSIVSHKPSPKTVKMYLTSFETKLGLLWQQCLAVRFSVLYEWLLNARRSVQALWRSFVPSRNS